MTTRRLYSLPTLAACCLLLAAACVTINVYFPEAAVKDLSERIEDAVAREAAAVEPADSTDTPSPPVNTWGLSDASPALSARVLSRTASILLALTATSVDAQEVVAPEVSSPAIRRLIASRAQRVAELDRFKAAGALGENNKALLEVRDLQALALPDRAKAQKLLRDENADRERMFREIAAATGADLSTLPQIQTTYAETLRQRAPNGHWVQRPEGDWTRKGG